jgi:RNase P/RNase MRP subunit p30
MFQDICFPKNNEKDFIEVALKLGTKSLIFVYDFKDLKTYEFQKKELLKLTELKVDIGITVDEKSINKVSLIDDYIFCKTPPLSLIDHKKSYILYNFELLERSDFLHHRNSGLNQVMCNLMKEKDKILGISFSSLINSRNKGVILGRMRQNARFSRKFNLKTVIASFATTPYELRAEHELISFKKILGF